MRVINTVNSPNFDKWLLSNNYLEHNGVFTNYDDGIMVRLDTNGIAHAISLYGFETKAFQDLVIAMQNYEVSYN